MSARGQPKRLSLAFCEGKRQAPLCEAQALSLPLSDAAWMSVMAPRAQPGGALAFPVSEDGTHAARPHRGLDPRSLHGKGIPSFYDFLIS